MSDHSPLIVKMKNDMVKSRKIFKYLNMWADSKDFLQRVSESWQSEVQGRKMYQLVVKMKRFKPVLLELNKQQFHDVQIQAVEA